jgi:outer membrane protein OmpA-like peptidoglycan-associated protein
MTVSTTAFAQEGNYKITKIPTQNENVWGAIPTIDRGIIFVENTDNSANAETYSSRLVAMDRNRKESTLSIFEQYQRIGSPYISNDGREFYFVISGISHTSKSKNIFKSGTTYYPLQLMITANADKEWTQPVEFKYNSNNYSIADPCISPDGAYLYFTSDKSGGYGGSDIYRSKRNIDGNWGEPENLGGNINSTGNERFPRFDIKGNFYFSSESGSGGNLDLFVCSANNGNFKDPVKMDEPFNSEGDDFAISFIDENSGYISSNRDGTDHIYLFELIMEEKVEPVKAAEIIKDTIKVIKPIKVADTVKTQTPDATLLDFLKKGKLQYINFDFDKWKITDKHISALKSLMDFMQQHPTVTMEVSGYTDCKGANDYNLKLSHRRAISVRDYLIDNGMDSSRIVVKEFGSTNPLIDCEKSTTEIAHATNRRVEYKVLKY